MDHNVSVWGGVRVAFLAVILIGFFVTSRPWRFETVVARNASTPPECTIAFCGSTEDPERFAVIWFQPLLDRLYEEFPIESVRLEIVDFLSRSQRGEIEVRFMVGHTPGRTLIAMSGWTDRPATQFFAQNIITYAVGCAWQIPCLEDMLAHSIIHERYHLDHHVAIWRDTIPDATIVREGESEACWYSAEHALLPMATNGRLKRIQLAGPLQRALDAYRAAQGDRNSPAWQEFVDWITDPSRL